MPHARLHQIPFALLASVLLACATSTGEDFPLTADLALVGVEVLTMDDRTALEDQTVLIEAGRITFIGPHESVPGPEGARVIEGRGRFLMPGLVDAHIHLRHADSTALLDYLRAGITSAREMNGRPFLLDWRDRIETGDLAGPWLHVAAPTLGNWSSPKEGYPTPQGTRDAAEIVQRFHSDGYDWIKVYSFLPSEPFAGVVQESNRLGLPVGGHVAVDVGLAETLSSGIRSIEHLAEYVGSSLTPAARELDEVDFRSLFGAGDVDWETLDALVAATVTHGVWNIPTLVWFDRNLPAGLAEDAWSNPALRRQGAESRREIVRRLFEAGALLAVGTDSDAGDQLDASAIHDEMEALTEAGLAPTDVLELATLGGATLLGAANETGTVAVGKRADLLLLGCDPRADLGCVRQPEMVLAQGQVVVEGPAH